ncbi:hypothetical protein FY046_01765 [Erwinia sp. 1181_3]|uniref:hypothetical protein n=1 Tax=Erwinia sp. 1181_3 TaxID=2605957 RepID=UPI00405999B3
MNSEQKQYRLYEDGEEIHVWESVYNPYWQWHESYLVARYLKEELRTLDPAQPGTPLALAIELLKG